MTVDVNADCITTGGGVAGRFGMIHEAEMIVLGCCMLSADAIREVCEIVRETDFREPNAFIFGGILDNYGRGAPVWPASVNQTLSERGEPANNARTEYLSTR